jgi:hypothetical protein
VVNTKSRLPCKNVRNTVPPIVSQKVDMEELKVKLGEGSREMDIHIDEGKMPTFGYPLVQFSPMGGPSKLRPQDDLWQIVYAITMQNQPGKGSVIKEMLVQNDVFVEKHEQLLRDFSRGRYMSREYAQKLQEKGIFKGPLKEELVATKSSLTKTQLRLQARERPADESPKPQEVKIKDSP